MLTTYAVFAVLVTKFLVFLLFICFYLIERKAHIIKWAFALGAFSFTYVFELLIENGANVMLYSVFQQISFISAALLAINGTYTFIGKKTNSTIYIAALALILYAIAGVYLEFPFLLYHLPIRFSIGIAIIITAVTFLKYPKINVFSKYIVGWTFILWALHISDYPFLRPVEWFAPYGFILGAILAFILPVSMLLVFLQQAKVDLSYHAKFRNQLIDFLPDAVFIHCNGKIVFANPTAVKLLGTSSEDALIGKDSLEIVHPDYISTAQYHTKNIYEQVIDHQSSEIKLLRFDGSAVDVESRGLLYTVNGQRMLISIHRDLSAIKHSEQLEKNFEESSRLLKETVELDKLKTEFLANISHDLKTPLNVLLSSIQLLDFNLKDMHNSPNMKIKKHLNVMKKNCLQLLKLINNLIDSTRIGTGFLTLELQNYNIVTIVEEITTSVCDYVKSKGLHIEFDTQEEEIICACDIDKMERILLNLLSNAVKFTPPGGSIFVDVKSDDTQVFICVRDTGIGIKESSLNLIFERFRQAEQALTKKHEGSGIGLSLVKSLIELHKGSISVKSTPGVGSEFTIMLPIIILEKESAGYTNFTPNGCIEKIDIEFADMDHIFDKLSS